MAKSKVKLQLIANATSRRTTFKKRRGGIMKKLNELVTLCDVKACAVFYNGPNDSKPVAWPSREGAKEVISRFMEFPEEERTKKMYDQEGYMYERVMKEQGKMKKLQEENREFELRELMFDLLEGKKIMDYRYYDENVLKSLSGLIDHYLNKLTQRMQILQGSGEPTAHPAIGDVNLIAGSDVPAVTRPNGFLDQIHQYQTMNMNVNQQAHATFNDHIQYQNMNQQELVQYQVPTNFFDHVQYQNMNHQEPFQYQEPANVYDQNQHRFYGSNQDMSSDLNHNLGESLNQYPNQHQPFINQWMAQPQQMSYVEELASFASMDDNFYRYHQLPTTSHMPSSTTTTTTTTTVDLSAPNTNNNLWPTRFGL